MTWTKELSVDQYSKQVQRWNVKEKDLADVDKFHEMLDFFKNSKDSKWFAKYVNDKITEKCAN